MTNRNQALALWLAANQQASHRAEKSAPPGDIHLHQHVHHAPPAPPLVEAPTEGPARVHPLTLATYAVLLSIAVSVPLALLGAMVEALNRPDVEIIQPARGEW